MRIPKVSSVPTRIIVAHLSVHASVRSAKLCLEDTVANTKGKRIKGGGGTTLEVAHKWATWLHNPCRLGGPHRFRAGGRIRGGPQVGKVAT